MAKKHSALLMRTYVILVFCFMYLPIAVMIAFSFNESKSRSNFTGFTLGWYKSLFHNEMILSALGLSLVLALVSSIIATVLGTLATLGINSMSRKSQLIINNISYVPVVNPEIITGVSLMLLFVMAQNFGIGGESGIFGWPTLLIAHITFNIPYVIFNVGPKLRQLDPSLYNAALDLGCTPRQAFTKVIMPQLSPAILSAFLICLTYSIDDFMISYFNSGTKIGADRLAESFYRSFDLPVTIVRPFNTYGPRQSGRAIIPTIITQLLAGQTEIKLGSLTPTRDFNYVKDTANGFMTIADCDAAIGQELNIATGVEHSIGDLANELIAQINPNAKIVCEAERLRPEKSEVNRLLGDSTKLRELTGWAPQYTFEQGLAATIEFLRGNLDQYKVGQYIL